MERRLLLVLLNCCLAASLHAQVNTPRIGFARYADGSVRAVYGLPSDFVIDPKPIAYAEAASFSQSGGLISQAGQIQLVDSAFSVRGTYNAGEMLPLLNMGDDQQSAIAWLPGRNALLHWIGSSFVEVKLSEPLQQVTSVWVDSSHVAKLLLNETGQSLVEATVDLNTGNVVSRNLLPGISSPAYESGTLLIFADKQGLEIETRNGVRRTFSGIPSNVVMERMSTGWFHISSPATGQNWALHLRGETASLAELPGPSVERVNALMSGTRERTR